MISQSQARSHSQPCYIGIVIPVRNRKALTESILAQLQSQIQPLEHPSSIQIVVVDDASSDGTPEMIKMRFPEVHVLEGDGSLWWTGAIAEGMKYIQTELQADYLVWLNDDISVAQDFVHQLVELCHNTDPQKIVGGIIYHQSYAGWIAFSGLLQGNPVRSDSLFDQQELEVETLNGNMVVMPRSALEVVGLPDVDRFRHYGGDYDFVHRARKKGFKVVLSQQLRGETAFTIDDFLRYMPLWIQWYFAANLKDKKKVFRSLTSFKSPYNVAHMIHSMNRDKVHISAWVYLNFYLKKVLQLVLVDFLPRSLIQKRLEQYFSQEMIPQEVVHAIVRRRFPNATWSNARLEIQ